MHSFSSFSFEMFFFLEIYQRKWQVMFLLKCTVWTLLLIPEIWLYRSVCEHYHSVIFFLDTETTPVGAMLNTSGSDLSWLAARHLLVCYLEAIIPYLNILSYSRLLPSLKLPLSFFQFPSFVPWFPPSSLSHICHADLYLSITFASSLTLSLLSHLHSLF